MVSVTPDWYCHGPTMPNPIFGDPEIDEAFAQEIIRHLMATPTDRIVQRSYENVRFRHNAGHPEIAHPWAPDMHPLQERPVRQTTFPFGPWKPYKCKCGVCTDSPVPLYAFKFLEFDTPTDPTTKRVLLSDLKYKVEQLLPTHSWDNASELVLDLQFGPSWVVWISAPASIPIPLTDVMANLPSPRH